jgi:hypothetical protein
MDHDQQLLLSIGKLQGKIELLTASVNDTNVRMTAALLRHDQRIEDVEEDLAKHIARQQQNSYLLKAAASVAGIIGVLAGIGVALKNSLGGP